MPDDASLAPITEDLVARLVSVVGAAHVLTTGVEGFTTDWTGRFRGRAPAVVRPADVDEVAAVLEACNDARVAVVPQGGNTGLVGGSVPLAGEIVLSLRRLAAVGAVDEAAAQLTAGAGATLATVQDRAAAAGLAFAVDLAARDDATIGGMVATNAGGMHVLRWGPMRHQVLGIEAVLADGRVVRHLGGLVKDNTGYDLASLVCGSEGTLAVVTAARLHLVPRFASRVVVLAGMASIAAAVDAVARWRRVIACLDAAELFLQPGLDLVCRTAQLPPPFPERFPAYVLLEASDDRDPSERMAAAIDDPAVGAVAVAQDPVRCRALWRYRDEHSLAINTLGPPHKLDVTVPLSVLADFVERVPREVAALAPGAETWLFGHLGDGNIHVNVTGLDPDDESVDDLVLRLVASLGGSISAEHGIGTAKKAWLSLNRTPEELSVFRAIKSALDPRGILNPNVLLGS